MHQQFSFLGLADLHVWYLNNTQKWTLNVMGIFGYIKEINNNTKIIKKKKKVNFHSKLLLPSTILKLARLIFD